MKKTVINANKRTLIGKKVKHLRKQGKIPAVIIRKAEDAIPIAVDAKSTVALLRSVSSAQLLTIDVDGEEYVTLLREVQRDTLKNIFLHFDFQQISMTEKITVNVPLELHGVAPAVSEYSGVVTVLFDSVEVECMAVDIPEKIDVDISGLVDLNSSIAFGELNVPENVEVTGDPEEKVIVISSLDMEIVEEEEELEGEEFLDGDMEPEVIEKGKADEGEFDED